LITLEKIKSLGFESYQLEKNIFLIKNFLSENILNKILIEINSLNEKDWQKNPMMGEWENKFYDLKQKEIVDLIKIELNKLASLEDGLFCKGGNQVLRQTPGNGMNAHIDGMGGPEEKYYRMYAIIIYLNEDFEGGELHYLKKGITLKPEKNSLILFKTIDEYVHEVKKVKGKKTRYCMPLFLFKDKDLIE
jgi:Rps23 Pro-64 3,4-dihydroxylase Tpa1-like proline 4-hydroxylase